MDFSTQAVVIGGLLTAIQGTHTKITRPTVRVRLDGRIGGPDVDENSWLGLVLERLQNMCTVTSLLAEEAHAGTAANDEELDTIEHVKDTLRNIVDNISPPASLPATATDSSD